MTPRPTLRMALAVLALAVALPALPGAAADDAATWIGRMNRALLPSDALTARVRLETRDGFGGEETIAFDLAYARREGVAHTLIEVREPPGRAGIVYQVTAPGDGPIRRWAWLPEAHRLRSMKGVHRTDAFLGSEFTFEDVGIAAPAARRQGRVERVSSDGRERVVLTSDGYHVYGKVVTVIDPATHLPVRVDYYDRAGQLFRRHTYEGVREVEGEPMATRILAKNLLTGSQSELVLGHVDLDAEIPTTVFTESVVEQRLRRGERPVPAPPDAAQEG